MNEQVSVVNFRVHHEDVILFKKLHVIEQSNKSTSVSTREFFVFLLERIKKKFQEKNMFFLAEESSEFTDNFSYVGKKNLKIQMPKKLLISMSEQEKKLFYDVAYSIIENDKSTDFSYPYAFKRIVELNQNLNNE